MGLILVCLPVARFIRGLLRPRDDVVRIVIKYRSSGRVRPERRGRERGGFVRCHYQIINIISKQLELQLEYYFIGKTTIKTIASSDLHGGT